jgi:HEAT repeats
MSLPVEKTPTPRRSLLNRGSGFACVFLPFGVLITTMIGSGETPQPMLAGGVATLAFLAFGLVQYVGLARACSYKACSPLYLIAVFVLWMTSGESRGWAIHVAMGMLIGVPIILFIWQEFLYTGRASLRKARALVRRIAKKTDWPENLADCRLLPEVKALREALRDNAEPVFVLLMHPRPQVRIAALAALEFRPTWNKGQAEAVVNAAKYATEPEVRSAAMMALGNVDDPNLVAVIAMYLRDTCIEVRAAAAVALLWDAERRWSLIRTELRAALSDSRCASDGALPCTGPLPSIAIDDLILWAAEAGWLGCRATLTLRQHFRRELSESPSPELLDQVGHGICDGTIPSALRVELAHLLYEFNCAIPEVWTPLLDKGQPSALRLLAAGAMLLSHQTESHEKALEALREVARVPNREMALQVASIVQRALRVDMGLPIDGPLPELKSKQAAEIACRVLDWAHGRTPVPETAPPRRSRMQAIPYAESVDEMQESLN